MSNSTQTWKYPTKQKAVTFCVTCRNRLWQLKQTLGNNLSVLEDQHEISLVDYGSTDEISDWVWGNFKSFIDEGKLNFFEVKNPVTWNVSKAKNLAHRISNGAYLFNLDADNFITSDDLRYAQEANKLGLAIWQYAGDLEDGSYGRIGLPREMFFKLGGYDESMLPMGGQDRDLLMRLNNVSNNILKKIPSSKLSAVRNNFEEKVSEVVKSPKDAKLLYLSLNRLNINIAKIRLETEGPIRVGGFTTYKGMLNGRMVTIDGFDNIRSY